MFKNKIKSQITNHKLQISPKSKIQKFWSLGIWSLVIVCNLVFVNWDLSLSAEDIKKPNVAGDFYPRNKEELSIMINSFMDKANPKPIEGDIFAIIVPHAGYGFSGETAAYAYRLIKSKPYKTVIIIGSSHYYRFSGISVYPEGKWLTPLGELKVDREFTQKLLLKDRDIFFDQTAFAKEHSVEVQLPFLQKSLADFKIVPIVIGDCSLETCKKLANLLKEAIGERKDILIVTSTDMYHGYDYEEAQIVDNLTIEELKNMDAEGLYYGLREEKFQLCGGLGVVSTILLAKELGDKKIEILKYTDSAQVTGKKIKGIWTVGYSSSAIYAADALSIASEGINKEEGEKRMLNINQRKKLLEIARKSIEGYLKNRKKLEISETDPLLLQKMGAFVTLHEHGQLRGCIGNLVGNQALYLTIRDMALESAFDDPRFSPLSEEELKDLKIEISVLSAMQKIDDINKIEMGKHGVLIRQGFRSGVFLPQVATETGWGREEFLSNLCAHKAGLSPDAWRDKATEVCIFTAEIFSEENP